MNDARIMRHLKRAMAAYDGGRLKTAEKEASAILVAHPNHPIALHVVARARFDAGRRDDGLRILARAIRAAPDRGELYNSLGNMRVMTGDRDGATQAYRDAVARDPGDAGGWCNLGAVLRSAAKLQEAAEALELSLRLAPGNPRATFQLGMVLHHAGRRDEGTAMLGRVDPGSPYGWAAANNAAIAFAAAGDRLQAIERLRRFAGANPDDPRPKHHIAALAREKVARAPQDYVSHYFDRFADSFDEVLERLDYRAPQVVVAEAVRLADARVLDRLVDLGCGTGLCGPGLRPLARTLLGVDLSQGMLDRAAPRGVYDRLERAELTEWLEHQPPGSLNMAVSADTLIYIGDIGAALAAACRALAPGGSLVATFEVMAEGAGRPEAGYAITDSGRFQHTLAYLGAEAERAGLSLARQAHETVRLEGGAPVQGHILTLTRPAG
ncbi:MAG: tetratricopeptide repeat protein [Pseudomonadota bacterium]